MGVDSFFPPRPAVISSINAYEDTHPQYAGLLTIGYSTVDVPPRSANASICRWDRESRNWKLWLGRCRRSSWRLSAIRHHMSASYRLGCFGCGQPKRMSCSALPICLLGCVRRFRERVFLN